MPPLLGLRGASSAQSFGLLASAGTAPPVSGDFWIGNQSGITFSTVFNADSSGNIIIGGGTGSTQFITKINSAGSVSWQRSSSSTSFTGAVTDSSGDVYCCGRYTISPNSYAYIVKFNSSGTKQWETRHPTAGTSFANISVDSSSNVFAAGNTFLGKFNGSTGALIWGRTITGTSVSVNDVSCDPSGNVYITGEVTVSSFTQGFLAKFNTSGTLLWSRLLSISSTYNTLRSCSAGYAGYIYVGGAYPSNSGMLALYDDSGTLQWNKVFTRSDATSSSIQDTAVSSLNGTVYVAGSQTGGITPITWAAGVDLSGNDLWKTNLGIASIDMFNRRIAFAPPNNVIIGSENVSIGATSVAANMPSDGSRTGIYSLNGYSFDYSNATATTLSAGTATSASGGVSSSSTTPAFVAPSTTFSTTVSGYTIVDVP
jgi:hypothetical protein